MQLSDASKVVIRKESGHAKTSKEASELKELILADLLRNRDASTSPIL